MLEEIVITGARENNLQNINVTIPRNKLVVFTGVSGSGKSSLAFGTLYAEGQRRFMESLSSYARMFLGQMHKPDVDKITGLSPAIAIDQKTTNNNPRSTVGTVTEIYDYLRLLYARIGIPHCPKCGKIVERQTVDQIIDQIYQQFNGQQIHIEAPIVRGAKGSFEKRFEELRKSGYVRIKIDGNLWTLDEEIKLDKNLKHNINVVIDRLKALDEERTRLVDGIEIALRLTNGLVTIVCGDKSQTFSDKLACVDCGISIPELEPRSFSFNSPFGACEHCNGLGFVAHMDPEKLRHCQFESIRYMTPEEAMTRYHETSSEYMRNALGKMIVEDDCPACHRQKLKPEVLAVTVGDYNIAELTSLPITAMIQVIRQLKLTGSAAVTAQPIIKEVLARCQFLVDVGLHYLTLARSASSLSGGESQRIRLATQIGAGLVGVLYILDEPSIGLHQRDNQKLLSALMHLRDQGNTLVVVEHDEETIRSADFIVDVGPYAGVHGGQIVVAGTVQDVINCQNSVTGRFLSGRDEIAVPTKRRPVSDKMIWVRNAKTNNLQNIDVAFPVGVLTVVTGVSGSGKSSLVNYELYQGLQNGLGAPYVDKIIKIDQSPIGRTPRSNPATYTGLWTLVRELFAATKDAKERGFTPGRFSFNVPGGRCENCEGDGTKKIEMHFLPDIYVTCDVCDGKRFNRETLSIQYKGKNIWDILEMTVDEACEFFAHQPKILKRLQTLQDVGLGYIKLGQPATELSGGEAQRVKLATELARPMTGQTMYILDEPTTGLSTYDVKNLIEVLNRLVDAGNTMVVIEHNLDVIKVADYIIDMGPEGGNGGGQVIATGTPEAVSQVAGSFTGQFLKPILAATK